VLEKVVAQGESKVVPIEGVEGGGPVIQIRLSGETLELVVRGSEEVVWLFLYFLR